MLPETGRERHIPGEYEKVQQWIRRGRRINKGQQELAENQKTRGELVELSAGVLADLDPPVQIH